MVTFSSRWKSFQSRYQSSS